MTGNEFIEEHIGAYLLHAAGMLSLSAFLLGIGTKFDFLIIILLTWIMGLILVQVTLFFRQRAHLRELEAIMESLDQKQLFTECVPKPLGIYEKYLFELLKRSGRAMIGAVSEARASQKEYREYIESWVHEIKTPITAAQLICRNTDTHTRHRLLPELAQIENHVERALFYARAESPERDFVVRRVSLHEIVAEAVGHHKALLIQCGISVELEELHFDVYTDEKWAVFLIGQLLQNAARYRRESPRIELSARMLGRRVQLSVRDNGMGISRHELPRVFERGFTGSNGRNRSGATGMGLYLCGKLAGFLQIDLMIQSVEGESTTVTLTFPAASAASAQETASAASTVTALETASAASTASAGGYFDCGVEKDKEIESYKTER